MEIVVHNNNVANLLDLFGDLGWYIEGINNVLCPECDELSLFTEAEVGCEDCGSHIAVKCDNCNEYYDLIFRDAELLQCNIDYWQVDVDINTRDWLISHG